MQEGWEARLAELVDAKRQQPFQWGRNDCLTFANEARRAVTGKGFCDDWLGGYRSASEALRAYRAAQNGPFADIVAAIDARLTRITPVWPPRGAIVARKVRKIVFGFALGTVVGKDAAFLGANGLEFHRPRATDAVWI